jgi:hypothetical protein
MKNIYYLYSYDTGECLYIGRNRKEFDAVWDEFQENGIDCWSEDMRAKINNIKIEQRSKK